jgi:hypothetical protein
MGVRIKILGFGKELPVRQMMLVHDDRADNPLGRFRVMVFQPRNELFHFAARTRSGAKDEDWADSLKHFRHGFKKKCSGQVFPGLSRSSLNYAHGENNSPARKGESVAAWLHPFQIEKCGPHGDRSRAANEFPFRRFGAMPFPTARENGAVPSPRPSPLRLFYWSDARPWFVHCAEDSVESPLMGASKWGGCFHIV